MTELQFMTGTEGRADYLKLGEKDGNMLGVKVVAKSGEMTVLRLRAEATSDAAGLNPNTWGVNFGKVNSRRASAVVQTNSVAATVAAIFKGMKGAALLVSVDEAVAWINGEPGEQLKSTEDEIPTPTSESSSLIKKLFD